MSGADPVLALDLPDRAAAAGTARQALGTLNADLQLVTESRLRDARLLVTELVNNAIVHAGASGSVVQVEVHATSDLIRVAVRDLGEGFDPASLRPPAVDTPGGFGLQIVGTLATRWGVDRGEATTVWFEIERPRRVSSRVDVTNAGREPVATKRDRPARTSAYASARDVPSFLTTPSACSLRMTR